MPMPSQSGEGPPILVHSGEPIDRGLPTAFSVVYMVPTIILYLIVRRHLLRATVVGALQGAG